MQKFCFFPCLVCWGSGCGGDCESGGDNNSCDDSNVDDDYDDYDADGDDDADDPDDPVDPELQEPGRFPGESGQAEEHHTGLDKEQHTDGDGHKSSHTSETIQVKTHIFPK